MSWHKITVVAALAMAVVAAGLYGVLAGPSAEQPAKEEPKGSKWVPAVEPKPLSENVQKGLAFLAKMQHKNGGWSQGEESQQMGQSLAALRDVPNVADTCVAALALIRSGSTPSKGPHADSIRKGLDFICAQIEESDEKSLFITSIRGTRVQMKLGSYVDTFLSAMLLAEVKDQMPDAESRKRIMAALDKTMDKIEKNQRSDGTWASDGWAPTISQAMAAKAINRAAQSGVEVDEGVREKTEQYAQRQHDTAGGKFSAEGSAGVQLYSGSASLGAIQDSANTNYVRKLEVQNKQANAKTEPERQAAKDTLERYKRNEEALAEAQKTIVKKLDDERFIQGFGSNGGEEFLSYMNIGESLVVKGGDDWKKWDDKITANLNRVQNADGSWTGHHCITGRTFCTAAALLVLTTDRAPVPLAAKIKKQ